MKTDLELCKEKACEQFVVRATEAAKIEKIDNGKLYAGEPMYFYCQHCGILIETLPEEFLFPPRNECSQCAGLKKEGWLEEAKQLI